MRLGAGAVEAYCQTRQSGIFQPKDDLPREQRRGAGRERNAHAHFAGVRDEFKQVRTLDRIATGEHENRHFHGRNLIDEVLALVGGQFHGMAQRLRSRPAMHASQVAGLRHFPNGEKRLLVEIDGLNLRIHDSIRTEPKPNRSDQSRMPTAEAEAPSEFNYSSALARNAGLSPR